MRKIANTTELQSELQGLLDYAQSYQPSRVKLATALLDVSERVAASSNRQKLIREIMRATHKDFKSSKGSAIHPAIIGGPHGSELIALENLSDKELEDLHAKKVTKKAAGTLNQRVADRALIGSDETAFMRLLPGMQVQIETRLYKKRVLTVTEAPQKIHNSWYVFVQSGKVRPSHRAGGSLQLDEDGRMQFQPTIQQQIDYVDRFQVIGEVPLLHG